MMVAEKVQIEIRELKEKNAPGKLGIQEKETKSQAKIKNQKKIINELKQEIEKLKLENEFLKIFYNSIL